ncbi:MAG TPA: hypothetical protein VEK08_00485 [Planctomycetota bacterium]|nr:hypothetical protein [Planctomycetota bacterium]
MRALVLLASLVSVVASAAETADPPTLMTTRGKLLKEESFKDQASVTKGNPGGWYIYKGKFEVVDGELKISEQKEDGHHPAMSSKLPSKNLIMQCRFKVGNSKWQGLSLDNGKAKEHIFRAMINTNGVSLKRMSGMGPTTKGQNMAEQKIKLDSSKWYTLLVEIFDKEAVLQIPEAKVIIFGENEGVAQDKDRFEFISGGENAWFDDLKVWEAEANPKWAQVKASLPPPAPAKK